MEAFLRYHNVFRQSASPACNRQRAVEAGSSKLTTEAYEAILTAAVDEAIFASAASSVVNDRLHDHSVAGLKFLHFFSNFFHGATEFVTECQRHAFASNRVGRSGADVGSAKIFVEVSLLLSDL